MLFLLELRRRQGPGGERWTGSLSRSTNTWSDVCTATLALACVLQLPGQNDSTVLRPPLTDAVQPLLCGPHVCRRRGTSGGTSCAAQGRFCLKEDGFYVWGDVKEEAVSQITHQFPTSYREFNVVHYIALLIDQIKKISIISHYLNVPSAGGKK